MLKQRPVKDGGEPGLTEQCHHLIETDAITDLDAKAGKQGRVSIDAHDACVRSPVRPLTPVPADEAGLPNLGADRAVLLKEPPNLVPPLPVVADITDAVGLLGGAGTAPRNGCMAGILMHLGDTTGVEGVKQE